MTVTTILALLLLLVVISRTLRRRLVLGSLLLLFYIVQLGDKARTEINNWPWGVQATIVLMAVVIAIWALRSTVAQQAVSTNSQQEAGPSQAPTPRKGNGILD